MIEVPTALLAVETIAREADFLSVGSNDLHQFLYAADRGGERVAGRYDVLDPLFLSALQRIVVAGEAAGTPVALCGEMAGKPLERSEEHTSELQSLMRISYAVFCLKK